MFDKEDYAKRLEKDGWSVTEIYEEDDILDLDDVEDDGADIDSILDEDASEEMQKTFVSIYGVDDELEVIRRVRHDKERDVLHLVMTIYRDGQKPADFTVSIERNDIVKPCGEVPGLTKEESLNLIWQALDRELKDNGLDPNRTSIFKYLMDFTPEELAKNRIAGLQ